jgi:hypothetical protein
MPSVSDTAQGHIRSRLISRMTPFYAQDGKQATKKAGLASLFFVT